MSRLFIVYRDSVRLSVIINVGQVRPRPDSLRTAPLAFSSGLPRTVSLMDDIGFRKGFIPSEKRRGQLVVREIVK